MITSIAMPLLDSKALAGEIGCAETQINRLRRERKIPAIKLGYRTFKYDLPRVLAALECLEIAAVGTNRAAAIKTGKV